MADNQKTQDTVKPATDSAREQLDRLTVLQDADGADLNAKDYAAEDSEAGGVSAGMHGGANQSSLALASQAKPAAFSEDGLRASSFETAPAGDVHAGNASPPASFTPSSFTSFFQAAIQTVQNAVGNINIFSQSPLAPADSPTTITSFTTPVARTVVTPDQAGNDGGNANSSEGSDSGGDNTGGGNGDNSGSGDHDNGHGNDNDHDDDSNPGQGGGNHGTGNNGDKSNGNNDDASSSPPVIGDHDQGRGNDGRDVGNDKMDENDHSGKSGGSGIGDPNDGDDARGNNHQDHIDIPAPANTVTWDHQIDQSTTQNSGQAPTAGWMESGNGVDRSVDSALGDKGGGKNKTGGGKNAVKEVLDTPTDAPDHADSHSNGLEHADKSHGG